MIIHPLVYHFSELFYRTTFEHSQMQTVAYFLVLAHFLKRELETLLCVTGNMESHWDCTLFIKGFQPL